jgi:bifunctional enzyme CysN/CysC/sulfate adenylyltransferase subunit 1
VLYQLLGNLVDEGRRIGSIAEMDVGNSNPEAPVGTTLALLERSMKVMSAVQARVHAALSREFQLIADVIREYMPPDYEYAIADNPQQPYSRQADFDDRVDIIPVSDPNASLLRIPHLVIAINKMDLVGWSEARFNEIRETFESFLTRLDIKDVKFIPLSALNGDNVVDPSPHTPWYSGPTLLGHLESVHIASDWNLQGLRFPVQWVNRPNDPTDAQLHDFRGLSGQIASGIIRVGQRVMVLPSGLKSTIQKIWTLDGELEEAFCPQSVTLQLAHDLDISRGDMIVGLDSLPGMSNDLLAKVCWMNPRPLQKGRKYFLKHATQTVQAVVTSLESRINIQTIQAEPEPAELAMNDIGEIRIKTAKPVVFDGYGTNRLTGAFILVEQGTNATVAAGMLNPPMEAVKPEYNDFAI